MICQRNWRRDFLASARANERRSRERNGEEGSSLLGRSSARKLPAHGLDYIFNLFFYLLGTVE